MIPFNNFIIEFNKLDIEVKKIFYDFFSNENPFLIAAETHWRPNIDMYLSQKGIIVKAEIAGVKQKDIKIFFEDTKLRLKGIRHDYSIPEQITCEQIEITYGEFERLINIPTPSGKNINEKKINATYKEGFLFIYLPFINTSKKEKKIEIQIKGDN